MSIKKIVAVISTISIFAIALFIYPSMNQSVKAEQMNHAGYNNQSISFQDATGLIKGYQRINASNAVIVQNFGKELVDKIIAQPGCVGVRMYYGRHTNGNPGLIILGVDKSGKDMVKGVLAFPSVPCPPYCDGLH